MATVSTYVKDEQGATFIAASQRPDGTWRKPRRVKDGYIPQEEVPLYESKGKQFAKNQPRYPVGFSPEFINEAKAKREKAERAAAKTNPIPGLVVVSTTEGKSNKKKKKKKNSGAVDEISDGLSKTQLNVESKTQTSQSKSTTSQSKVTSPQTKLQQETETPPDPAKRIKNLRKRLREIESIEQKIAAGQQKLEKEQLDKVARKQEVISEIEQLTLSLESE
ncbi:hypothetical protein L9F63_028333 [Diploptera punctata]|uniref:Partner of Y14 and mago n=1 Tax=Diploptera punctata TaxID=6984 RepID=A0AAD8EE13_DIPPU|nr:hypothetical protein L9F63_028333 [Diploptera punctata]